MPIEIFLDLSRVVVTVMVMATGWYFWRMLNDKVGDFFNSDDLEKGIFGIIYFLIWLSFAVNAFAYDPEQIVSRSGLLFSYFLIFLFGLGSLFAFRRIELEAQSEKRILLFCIKTACVLMAGLSLHISLSVLKVSAVNVKLVEYTHPALDDIIRLETELIMNSLTNKRDACASLHDKLTSVVDLQVGEQVSIKTQKVVDQNGDLFSDAEVIMEDQPLGFDTNVLLPILRYTDPKTNEVCRVPFKVKQGVFSKNSADPMQGMRDVAQERKGELTESIMAVELYPPKLYAFIVGDIAATLGVKGYDPEPVGNSKYFDFVLFWINIIVMGLLAFEVVQSRSTENSSEDQP